MALEIACDESGYEGDKLIPTTTDVFAHASVRLDLEAAAECVRELRSRIRSPATEYKAVHLLRDKHRSALLWFLRPEGPLPGHADVYLVDKAYLILDRLVDLLAPEPGHAAVLYEQGRRHPDRKMWHAFLCAANNLMRTRTTDVEAFFHIATELATASDRLGATMRRLTAGRALAREFRDRLLDDSTMPPLDPLMPAVVRAVERWSDGAPVSVVHDRQRTLVAARVARLRTLCGGRLAELRFVDSLTDPRVQIADFLAGIATRRIASDALHGRGDPELASLLRPMLNRHSIWGDARSWAMLSYWQPRPVDQGVCRRVGRRLALPTP